ncbi:Zinc knuckle CX2CX4HX4C protein [Raphanus sativus]|nr:Zinc knuckle CX2CX4HX4C protein [Raphanus sativus]
MRPLDFYLDTELPSGEIKVVELQYENLDKHCFSCKSLCHETKDCPASRSLKDRLSKPVGINQPKPFTVLKQKEGDKMRGSYLDSILRTIWTKGDTLTAGTILIPDMRTPVATQEMMSLGRFSRTRND